MTALAALSYWGWELFDSAVRILPTVALPLIGATVWGVFAVPNDPSRSGDTVIAVPGNVRFLIEMGLFGFATAAIYASLNLWLAIAFAAVVIAHYAVSYDRVQWLLKQK